MNILKEVKKVYEIFFWMLMPFIVIMLPIIPAVLFDELYALLMIFTFPAGFVLMEHSAKKIMDL